MFCLLPWHKIICFHGFRPYMIRNVPKSLKKLQFRKSFSRKEMLIFIDFQKIVFFSENTKSLGTVTQNHQHFTKKYLLARFVRCRQMFSRFWKTLFSPATLTLKTRKTYDFPKFCFHSTFLMVLMETTVSSCFEVY